MVAFYRTTIESVLTYCISAWYSGCTAADKRALQRVINTAHTNHWLLTAPHWKTLPTPATSAGPNTSSRPHHTQNTTCLPSYPLADGAPSRARTTRLKDSFSSMAIRTSNSDMHLKLKFQCALLTLQSLYSTAS